ASAQGQGSTFTLYLPQTHVPVRPPRRELTLERPSGGLTVMPLLPLEPAERPAENRAPTEATVEDDRGQIETRDKVLLIVEDDANYARILLGMAHEKGFKAVIARSGSAALSLVRELKPAAVTLDIHLPDVDGWKILDRLKIDFTTRHIPVHVITVDT